MQTIAVSEFKATCLKLFARLGKTRESLIVTKKGLPIAMIVPPPPQKTESLFGCMKGKIKIRGDIISPLGADDWDVLKK